MNSESSCAKKKTGTTGGKNVSNKMMLAVSCFVVALIIGLGIWAREENAKAEMISEIQSCVKPVFEYRHTHDDYKEVMQGKAQKISQLSQRMRFSEILLEQLDQLNESGDFEGFLSLIEALDYAEYQNESIKEMVAEAYQAREDEFFRSTDSIFDNISAIATLVRMEYYFDRQVVIDHLMENAGAVMTENGKGGYYDALQEEYQNHSGKGDPLGLGSGVGTYTTTDSYRFYGDFLAHSRSKQWYGTSSSDDCNSSYTSWDFRGEYFNDNNYRGGSRGMFYVVSNGSSYYINNSAGDYLILAFSDGNLKALLGNNTVYAFYGDYTGSRYIADWNLN